MNNLSSYCGLVHAKIRASDKDLLVLHENIYYMFKFTGDDETPVSVEVHAATTKESANGILFSNDTNGTEPLVNSTNGQAHETHL